ncbi:MAG: UDP-N-acetylglucosamine 2-epimerase (non-hydrolyzing) [Deltaproteobacteria bacterium]|nr:UDP-N-acetylglucosamine 2-epimerase (non-hydrolyzing) [Deltaproteobacteria bacterium]
MLIHLIAAARPNFMKIAPLYHALKKEEWATPVIVHTGQHYDLNMSDAFFNDLGLPEPDLHLGVGSGTHAEQTGQVMITYEKALMQSRPDLVVVVGDVNSTMAATLAAVKLGIEVAHLEAGLRCFDRTMPEEINRLVTDALADILWTPSPDADENLMREGISSDKIHRVGNIMIDSLEMLREKIEKQRAYKEFGLNPDDYGLVTLHRPSNVDNEDVLKSICEILARIAQKIPLVFPVHPRTRKNLEKNGLMSLMNETPGMYNVEPLSYTRFMNLVFNCCFAITDSGGIQEETTYLEIPCLTMRPNTERPITIHQGTNQLCKLENLENRIENVLSGEVGQTGAIEFWDGKTASRVVKSIRNQLLG